MRVGEIIEKKQFPFENSYLGLPEIFYSIQNPDKVPNPKIVKLNDQLAEELGIDRSQLDNEESLQIFSGNKVPEGMTPIAQAYAGHQFGHFTMLGDGRAVLIGEYITPECERVDIQLKGSGRTPYSRGGDGKASLGPMLREYIISEAMNGLGIPSTRSLAVISTGESIIREEILPGAVLTRVASSHIRVGTFEFAARWTEVDDVKALADYTLKRHYKEGLNKEKPYLYLLQEVIKRQAELITKWQLVGFIHGVMNTDNMTISGETIDYGPCAFMDAYDPETVFSSIDRYGRYAYGNQPNIAAWNLARFAETLIPLLHPDEEQAIELANEAIADFMNLYAMYWLSGMRKKLGLFNKEEGDEYLIEGLLSLMKENGADYTNTFRALTLNRKEDTGMEGIDEFEEWFKLWQDRLSKQEETKSTVTELMKRSNPSVIPRNHRVEEALIHATRDNDYSFMEKLLSQISNPYAYTKEQEEFITVPKGYSNNYKTYCGT